MEHQPGPALHGVVPSVDILFQSVAASRIKCFAALLTGMGVDGAAGMLELRNEGCFTMAQDQATSVVFGMPKEAINRNAVCEVGNLTEIRQRLLKAMAS